MATLYYTSHFITISGRNRLDILCKRYIFEFLATGWQLNGVWNRYRCKTYIHPKGCLGTRQVKGFKMKMKTDIADWRTNRLKKDKLKGRQRIDSSTRVDRWTRLKLEQEEVARIRHKSQAAHIESIWRLVVNTLTFIFSSACLLTFQ